MTTRRPPSAAAAAATWLQVGMWIGLLALAALPAHAQEGDPGAGEGAVEEIFGELGTASTVEGTLDEGAVRGRVFDASTGEPLERVTVVLEWPAPEGTEARQEVAISDAEGVFQFESVPTGSYDVSFIKSGYRNATMTAFRVLPEQVNRADFPLPPLETDEAGDQVILLDEFVVEAETAAELVTSLETRLESDQLLNILSAEDFSKFAAGDVAEALQRVAGVNIVDGQFAVIRGLEDRYSSTLYNGAPIPSPDPNRQSPQLDLFPSDIVSNLLVSKTFSSELPSNSAGGSINIVTHDYPEDFVFSVKAGTGWNENAEERFINFAGRTDVDRLIDGLDFGVEPLTPEGQLEFTEILQEQRLAGFRVIEGNPLGREDPKTGHFKDDVEEVIESDYQALIGGRFDFEGREFRFKAVAAREKDFETAIGWREDREPRLGIYEMPDPMLALEGERFGEVLRSPDLAIGQLSLTGGRFDQTVSTYERQTTYYGSASLDLDDEGNHVVEGSVLYTDKREEIVDFRENGYIPGLDYSTQAPIWVDGDFSTSVGSPLLEPLVTRSSSIVGQWRERPTSLGRGAPNFTNFFQSTTFQIDRELKIYQLNGDHVFDQLPDFHFSWATNWAETSQDEVVLGLRFFYEPCGFAFTVVPCEEGVERVDPAGLFGPPTAEGETPVYPTSAPSIDALGPGVFAANNRGILSANRIDETSRFTRLDVDYTFTDFAPDSEFEIAGGLWWERADRTVDSAFLVSPTISSPAPEACGGSGSQFFCRSDTMLGLGSTYFESLAIPDGNIGGLLISENRSQRDIYAWHVRGKLTMWNVLDLLGGVRREHIEIESNNDPFIRDPVTGESLPQLGGPRTFPSRFLFFDRLDDPNPLTEGTIVPEDFVFNDQVLGIRTAAPVACGSVSGSCVNITDEAQLLQFLNGRIDEQRYLPFGGVTLRNPFPFFEGAVFRVAYSQAVARPSFRELGYYVSVEPGSNDLVIGNPQLQLSDVESWDARVEYTWGPFGDLVAASVFQKDIELPIESIIIRDPVNFEDASDTAQFRTFFNNPNTADLWGVEVELRKSFDFFGVDFLNYVSIGGNYTWIDAEVARTQAELDRVNALQNVSGSVRGLFGPTAEGDPSRYIGLDETRRLFNQPRWILNADITFDHPDWGTRFTIAYFKISDVLNAAGVATLGVDQSVRAFTLDRYTDSYSELRATLSQSFELPRNLGTIKFSFSAKNLTDSVRRELYDPGQLRGDYVRREYRVGRDYSGSITFSRSF